MLGVPYEHEARKSGWLLVSLHIILRGASRGLLSVINGNAVVSQQICQEHVPVAVVYEMFTPRIYNSTDRVLSPEQGMS